MPGFPILIPTKSDFEKRIYQRDLGPLAVRRRQQIAQEQVVTVILSKRGESGEFNDLQEAINYVDRIYFLRVWQKINAFLISEIPLLIISKLRLMIRFTI
jgi:hypothetical protein